MSKASTYRGHDIVCIKGDWVFLNSKQLVSDNINIRCGHCGRANTQEGHDGCIGELPGLMNACCGHGRESAAYIQFLDKSIVSGAKAIKIMKSNPERSGMKLFSWITSKIRRVVFCSFGSHWNMRYNDDRFVGGDCDCLDCGEHFDAIEWPEPPPYKPAKAE